MRAFRVIFLTFMLCFIHLEIKAQQDVWLEPNRGQWHSNVLYQVNLSMGAWFLEKDGFTVDLNTSHQAIGHHHEEGEENHEHDPNLKIKHHSILTKFTNSSWKGELVERDSSTFYKNYFLGNDPTQWASKVHSFQYVKLIDFYEGIDLIIETKPDAIKYSLSVAPGADLSQIELIHNGADSVYLERDQLHIATRFGAIKERGLKVWNDYGEGKTRILDAAFEVDGNRVTFKIENYDSNAQLIIDPELIFSTFSGSTADNWGFTAAPDKDGNVFGAGIIMGNGYPTTSGAFDEDFNGGEGSAFTRIDIGVSKFTADGTSLIYSTYIGGAGNETPHSIVCNEQGELYVLGVTSSEDFPIAGSPLQTTFAGGPSTTQNGLQFSGSDLVILKLNPNGTNLITSTFFGGTGIDGLNLDNLHYNFGDQFRGEITLDKFSNVYIASSTRSTNFPTVNAFQNNLIGAQSAVVIKFNSELSTVFWSTYFGGNGYQTGNALVVADNGNVYLTGGTTASLPLPGGGALTDFQGGISDGYIVELDANSSQPINGTYIGTNRYDQSYFIQLDPDENVFVFGQSDGNIPISNGVYNKPNSGQFIQKLNSNLSEILWSTQVGGGNNTVEISPTAFLVSDCYEIYYAGWGGTTNADNPFSQANGSTTRNFPVTPDAYQSATSGNNFYLAVLTAEGEELKYASFMGGVNNYPNHVDGGTSRFDKNGRVYHAVCAACGGDPNGFTSTPNAFSTQNQSNNCNMAVFKFDLGIVEATLATVTPDVCLNNPIIFTNNSENANSFLWDFGDGNSSEEFEPSHVFTESGTYTVTLYALDSLGCYGIDSSSITVNIIGGDGGAVEPVGTPCPGEAFQLEAYGGISYEWSPGHLLDDSTSATPFATVYETTTFTVTITDSCASNTIEITLNISEVGYTPLQDVDLCIGDTIELISTGGISFEWGPAEHIIGSTVDPSIQVAPEETQTYFLELIASNGCVINDTTTVYVFDDFPDPQLNNYYRVCYNSPVDLTVSGGFEYEWSPATYLNKTTGSTVISTPTEDITYFIEFINACGSIIDSIQVEVARLISNIDDDFLVCPDTPFQLNASGGMNYIWSPESLIDQPTSESPFATISEPTVFEVIVSDTCMQDTLTVFVDLHQINTEIIDEITMCLGDTINLWANGGASYFWRPNELIIPPNNNANVLTSPVDTTTFYVDIITSDGCETVDSVSINVIYVPQTSLNDSDVAICIGNQSTLSAEYADSYSWYPDVFINMTHTQTVIVNPTESMFYFVDLTNTCGTITDSVFVEVISPDAQAFSDTIICPGGIADLYATGGINYSWSPASSLSTPLNNTNMAFPTLPTNYTVWVTDKFGCKDSATVFVDLHPAAFVYVSPDYYGFSGDVVQINADGSGSGGTYSWSPEDFLSCTNCPDPISNSPSTITYTVTYIDEYTCEAQNKVKLHFDALIYVPNTFTPNNDGTNDMFKAEGGNITSFHLLIFNRWGEILFESYDMNYGWDGTYNGEPSPDGVYIWKIRYADDSEINQEIRGHVTLIR